MFDFICETTCKLAITRILNDDSQALWLMSCRFIVLHGLTTMCLMNLGFVVTKLWMHITTLKIDTSLLASKDQSSKIKSFIIFVIDGKNTSYAYCMPHES